MNPEKNIVCFANRYLESIREMSSEGQEAAGIQGQEMEDGAQGQWISAVDKHSLVCKGQTPPMKCPL